MEKEIIYCDNCAVPLGSEHEKYYWTESPIDFDSGYKGESAVFCNHCNEAIKLLNKSMDAIDSIVDSIDD